VADAAVREAGDGTAVVSLRGITKRFPGVVANRDIDLDIRAGEVHVLLGENGAGKSTLIAILSGMQQPDEGIIAIDGRTARIASPRDALERGIGTVYQHLTLVPTLTVLENLMLGGPWYRRRDEVGTRRRLDQLAGLLGVAIDGDAPVGQLSLGQQQQVEIVKALWRGERVLILDEPTSMLTPQGVQELGKIIARLRDNGVAIILITHKLAEAYAFGERVSVLKLGRLVGEIAPDALRALDAEQATARIVTLMFGPGRGEDAAALTAGARPQAKPEGRPVLELEEVSVQAAVGEVSVHDVSFTVTEGEIFGIAGVDGNGQKELAEAIAGQRAIVKGDIRLDGTSIRRAAIAERLRRGLRYVTDDRLGEGTVGDFPLAMNLVLKRIGEAPFWRRGMVRSGAIERHAADLVARYDVRTPDIHTPIGKLSGGNIQKALLARELAQKPHAMVYNKPTYGLDLANTSAMRERIREEAEDGVATVLISTELEELLGLCGRIAVMSRGRLQGTVKNGPDAERAIGALMIGGGAV
jgi:ABC-type uncharacterized transport system ATPase subunit